jgi:uncharacterized protein
VPDASRGGPRRSGQLEVCTGCTYTSIVRFEWDEAKRRSNLRKHGVELADAVAVFDDPAGITMEDRDHGEERFVTMGVDAFGRILVVVYTYRESDIIRIISARSAEAHERKQYEE